MHRIFRKRNFKIWLLLSEKLLLTEKERGKELLAPMYYKIRKKIVR